MKPGFQMWMLKPKSSQNSGCTHSPNKLTKFKQTLSVRNCNCFLRQEKSVDVGILATREHSYIRSALWITKELQAAIQNKKHGMLTSGIVPLHDNAHPHTAASTLALLEHCNWKLFNHPPPPLQPWSCSKWLPPVYLTVELIEITSLQQ
jgi:hypothetical protein